MKTGVTVFSDFLSALGVKHTGAESDKAFRNMPFKSLFGFSRLLASYGIRTRGVKVTGKTELTRIPVPFLAQEGTGFVIVTGIETASDGSQSVDYIYYHEKKRRELSLFAQRWSGVALLAYPDGKSEEPCYRQHHLFELAETAKAWILGFCCVALVAFGFWRSGLWHDLSAIFLLCIDLFGLYITFQLLLKSLKVNVKTADRICGVLQKHGCDTVLEQKASKFFGLFGWAEVGVGYFTVSLLTMLCFPDMMHWLALANGCCLPFTFWSIWYQRFRIHTWCTMCVITQGLLWLQFFCYLFGGWWHDIFPLTLPLFALLAAYVAAVLGLNRVSEFINARIGKS